MLSPRESHMQALRWSGSALGAVHSLWACLSSVERHLKSTLQDTEKFPHNVCSFSLVFVLKVRMPGVRRGWEGRTRPISLYTGRSEGGLRSLRMGVRLRGTDSCWTWSTMGTGCPCREDCTLRRSRGPPWSTTKPLRSFQESYRRWELQL